MWNISLIVDNPVTHDDIIRDFLWENIYPTYATVTLPSSVTYTVSHDGCPDHVADRIRATVAKNIAHVQMFVCDPC